MKKNQKSKIRSQNDESKSKIFDFGLYLCILIFGFCISCVAHAGGYTANGPFTLRNQNPVYLQTVTLLPSRAAVLPPKTLEVRVDSAYSNIFEKQSNATTDVNLDMELWRIGYVATYGLLPKMEAGIEIPLLHFSGGFLDAFIQDYHDAFGFPNGGRDRVQNGLFHDEVARSNQTIFRAYQQTIHLGDITLFSKHQLFEEGEAMPAVAWRFAFKIPSGDSEGGLGSGNPGFGFGTAFEKTIKRFHGYLNMNYLVDGGNNAFQGLMYKPFFDFSLAGEFSVSRRVGLLVQLDGGTPRLKNTGLSVWDGVPLDLILGARGEVPLKKYADTFFWQAGFSEDVTGDGPSVDFTVFLSAGLRWDAH